MDIKNKILLAGLFHDVGKVIRRGTSSGEHSYIGAEFLKELNFDNDIVEACLYHHEKNLNNATLPEKHIAYITYIANVISSNADKRYIEGDDENKIKANERICLKSIFNKLNKNNLSFGYSDFDLEKNDSLILPTECLNLEKEKYVEIKNTLENGLKSLNNDSINSYLELIEGTMSLIPSCVAENDTNDISLFDHSKMTAGVSCCIYDYLKENNVENYKEYLLDNENEFLNKKAFILASFDISGIQKFIYNIKSENALKQLRARSIYLDLLGEYLLDEILTKCEANKTNVIYNGGGHAYIILPNTKTTKNAFDEVINAQNQWFLSKFREKLYVAGSYVECSANELCNKNESGEITNEAIYGSIIQNLSKNLSQSKLKRFSANQINLLNNAGIESSEECSVCGLNILNGGCICSQMTSLGKDVITKDIFVFSKDKFEEGVNLEFFSIEHSNLYMNLIDESMLQNQLKNDANNIVKLYTKNEISADYNYDGRLFIGDYFAKNKHGFPKAFDDFEEESQGIKRIAVLRADIDNLGLTFKSGFDNNHSNLSRFSTLSRMLSRYFKFHINEILESDEYKYLNMFDSEIKQKNISIVYSGGDDLCIVGSWNDVIETALLIRNVFKKYCSNTLTLSAGIGIYKSGYPMSRIANEVGELEDVSKKQIGKNSITLFTDDGSGTFNWDEFENNVIKEKLTLIANFLNGKTEKLMGGKSFFYNLIELLRKGAEKRPQIAYMLARLLEDNDDKDSINKMYEWSKNKNEKSAKEFIMALILYIYSIREG